MPQSILLVIASSILAVYPILLALYHNKAKLNNLHTHTDIYNLKR